MEAERVIAWEGVHAAYVLGIDSVRDIAARYEVSHTAIAKRAKRDGWTRASATTSRALIDSIANSTRNGFPSVAKFPLLATELDRLAELKLRSERNASLIADKLPELLSGVRSMQGLAQAAKAHRDLHETHFGKATPDVQVNTQINTTQERVVIRGVVP